MHCVLTMVPSLASPIASFFWESTKLFSNGVSGGVGKSCITGWALFGVVTAPVIGTGWALFGVVTAPLIGAVGNVVIPSITS